jgi:hypothetical protein
MQSSIRDLPCLFNAEGRRYVVEVCAPGKNPAPVSVGPFGVQVIAGVLDDFRESHDEPEAVVRYVMDYTKPLLPASVTPQEWGRSSDVVLAWICTHRAAATTRR